MAAKSKTAKFGLKAAKAAPAKAKIAKTGFKLGKRKAERTPAGTAVLYGQALVGNEAARDELRDAYTAARKAYARSADRKGRPNVGTLIEDRKARKEAGKASQSLRQALRIADRRRKKPKSSKGPIVAVIVVAGAGTAVALNEDLRNKLLAPLSGGNGSKGEEHASNGDHATSPAAAGGTSSGTSSPGNASA
jgi:hypothetical protein